MRYLLTFVLTLSLVLPAQARTAPGLDDEGLWVLARTLVAEADWSSVDHAAIAHVLVKRWHIARRPGRPLAGISFAGFVREYSALWKPKHTGRKRSIRALPWGLSTLPAASAGGGQWVAWATGTAKPSRGGWGGKRWDTVQRFVEKWHAGRVKDPCPKALHWGGTMDRPAGHWRPVSCGRTHNIFYTVDNPRSRS